MESRLPFTQTILQPAHSGPLEEVWEDPGWFLWEPAAIAMGRVELVKWGCHVGNIKNPWLPFLLGKSGMDRQSPKGSRQESWGSSASQAGEGQGPGTGVPAESEGGSGVSLSVLLGSSRSRALTAR